MLRALSKPSNYKVSRQWAHHTKDFPDTPSTCGTPQVDEATAVAKRRQGGATEGTRANHPPRTIHPPPKDEARPIRRADRHGWVDAMKGQ